MNDPDVAPTPRGSTVSRRDLSAAFSWIRRNADLTAGVLISVLLLLIVLAPGIFTPYGPNSIDVTNALQGPSEKHILGTDNIGRDLFARIIYGTRETLYIVIVSVAIAGSVGGLVGALCGFYKKLADTIASRVIDVILSFPPMILGVIITGILGTSTRNIIGALAVIYVPTFFRIARSSTMSESTKLYVAAGGALGYSSTRILFLHVIRNVIPPVIAQTVVIFPVVLQIESALSFIGLGVQPPVPDWGNILNEGAPYLTTAPWISAFPGVAILITALGVMLLGNAAQRWVNSR